MASARREGPRSGWDAIVVCAAASVSASGRRSTRTRRGGEKIWRRSKFSTSSKDVVVKLKEENRFKISRTAVGHHQAYIKLERPRCRLNR